MRGLKPANSGAPAYITKVASFTDAWIETIRFAACKTLPVSHLLQMRGLKPIRKLLRAVLMCRIFYRCVD